MYKELKLIGTNGVEKTHIIRVNFEGNYTSFPADPANTDYQAFLKYQAEGGKVYGADEEIPADEGKQLCLT